MPQDEFGGVAVEDTADEFGGVPLDNREEGSLYSPEEGARLQAEAERDAQRVPETVRDTPWEAINHQFATIPRLGKRTLTDAIQVLDNLSAAASGDPNIAPETITPEAIQERLANEDRIPSETEQIATGAINSVNKAASSFTSPLGIATLGVGALPKVVQPIVSGAFLGQIAHETPEIARRAGEASVIGTPEQKAEAYTDLALQPAMAALITKGGIDQVRALGKPSIGKSNVEPKTETATPGAGTEAGAETETQTFVGDKPVEVLEINRQKKTALVRDANDPEAAPDVVKLSDLEEREVTKGGDNNASSEQEAATVYGDLQPRTGEGAGEVSAEKGSGGIFTQARDRVRQAETPPSEVPLTKPAVNGPTGTLESPGNLNPGEPGIQKLNADFASKFRADLPLSKKVQTRMLSALKDPKVFDSIIRFIPVDMVDNFIGTKGSFEKILSNHAMLLDRLAGNLKSPVSRRLLAAIRKTATEIGAMPPDDFVRLSNMERSSATRAAQETKVTEQPNAAKPEAPEPANEPDLFARAERGADETTAPELTEQESAHVADAARMNEHNGITSDFKLVSEKTPEGATPDIAYVRAGKVFINVPVFRRWLKRIPADQRRAAVRSLLNEEGIHAEAQKVFSRQDMTKLWASLSKAEQSLVLRSYFGKNWKYLSDQLSPSQLGHEYMRRVLQWGMDMDAREVAENKGKGLEWLTQKGIDLALKAVHRIRQTLGTDTGRAVRSMLDRIEGNLNFSEAALGDRLSAKGGEEENQPLPLAEFKGEMPAAPHYPVLIEPKGGKPYEAYMNGYYDFSLIGRGEVPSIGKVIPSGSAREPGLSHGMLMPHERIIAGEYPKTMAEFQKAKEAGVKPPRLLQKAQNLPEWTREEMVKRGIDPNRTFNDVDLANPSVREAIQSDPTLSAAEKERLLSTGSLKEPEVSVGPGGASPSDVGSEKSDMQALTQAIEGTASPKESISDRLAKAKEAVANLPGVGKNAIKRGLLRMQGIASAIKSGLTTLPKFTTYKRILGQWNGANQIADHELRQFVKTIDRTIPQPKQEAMVNWIQADGNAEVLRQRATDSNPKFRKGYEDALKLTKDEQTAARNISSYLDARLQAGIDAGLLQDGVEQYITQIWKRENPISRKLSSDFSTAKLQPNFKFARQRIFDSYFEGEQAGYEPANKTVSAVIAAYDQSFNRALASRAFVKNLTEGKASDGRPLVEVSGTGSAVPRGEAPEAILINPKIKGADLADYRTIDHPALRKWAWKTQAPNGTPVFLKGDLLVHPEIYQHLKNVLGTSAWRKNIVGRAVLGTESTLKQAMFSLSGFHQVQETLHALGHRVNPTRLERINFSEPWQKEAVEHGLQVADYNALEKFGEGLNSGALINKIPLLGTKVMGPYTEWLFQDYIPRLKLTMYREALARNMNRYAKQLESGKITRDQIVENTAKQANAAFGELNYTWLGRNKTLQDTMRAFLVAPDFLEARSKFVGQAVRSHGREQLVALGILAATQYLTARIVNKINDDDPHWELKNAFSLVKGKHRYELRTIPGDLIHLIEDPHRFTTSRLAPIVRQSIEFVEGRDWRGVKRDAGEQIKDLAKVAVPISLKPYEGQRLWEAALNAFGVHETRYTAQDQIREKAQVFVKEHKGTQHQPEPTDEPTYGKLRAAVSNGNQSHAKDLLNELLKAHGSKRVFQTMRNHVRRPFTESRRNEADFRNSLSDRDKVLYDQARDEQREEFRKFLELWYKR